MPNITLLTDFGNRDGYAAVMKGALLRHAPGATLVDVGHDVPARDVQAAAWARVDRVANRLRGEAIHVDHFGNVISNIREEDLPETGKLSVRAGQVSIDGISTTYGDAPRGAPWPSWAPPDTWRSLLPAAMPPGPSAWNGVRRWR